MKLNVELNLSPTARAGQRILATCNHAGYDLDLMLCRWQRDLIVQVIPDAEDFVSTYSIDPGELAAALTYAIERHVEGGGAL